MRDESLRLRKDANGQINVCPAVLAERNTGDGRDAQAQAARNENNFAAYCKNKSVVVYFPCFTRGHNKKMAVTKYNIRRLKRLLAMLKENRYPNYPRFLAEMRRQDLAGAYELSARTLQRDIAFLKSEYGAPIEYDRERRGYYLADPDWSADIPLLDDHEMRAAVLGARLAENLMPAPVRQEMRSAVDTLLAVNDKGMDENALLLSLVALGSRVKVDEKVFRIIFDAWQKHRCAKIVYSPVAGPASARLIEPQALAFYEGNWYVKAIARTVDGKSIPPGKRGAFALALHRIKNADGVNRILFESKKVKAVYQGHYHPGARNLQNGIRFITFPAMCESDGAYFIEDI